MANTFGAAARSSEVRQAPSRDDISSDAPIALVSLVSLTERWTL
jgi:hypothetical protein